MSRQGIHVLGVIFLSPLNKRLPLSPLQRVIRKTFRRIKAKDKSSNQWLPFPDFIKLLQKMQVSLLFKEQSLTFSGG